MLASMSGKGTIIRIFNPLTGDKLHELRRGTEPAKIQDLSFESETGKYLTCTSNRDTIHVYKCESIA